MRTRRCILACLVLACALRAESVTVTLLATTDLHGSIYPYDYFTGNPAVTFKIAT
jgi:2',3'-cyclic-nucleotide 2'-phosphodiesterase (5'-nucleotidase family)